MTEARKHIKKLVRQIAKQERIKIGVVEVRADARIKDTGLYLQDQEGNLIPVPPEALLP